MQHTRNAIPAEQHHRKRKLYIAIAALLIAAIAVIFFWAFSSNKATIISTKPGSHKPFAPKTYQGRYFSFEYPGGYSLESQKLTSGGTELATIKADTAYEKLLTIRVEQAGGDKLAISDSSYYLRQSHPDQYHKQPVTIDGSAATEWLKNDGTEITVYIPKGVRYAVLSFSITDSNDTASLPGEVSALLNTFHWQ